MSTMQSCHFNHAYYCYTSTITDGEVVCGWGAQSPSRNGAIISQIWHRDPQCKVICISSRALERHRDRKWVATVKRNRPPLSSFRCRVRKFVRGITGSSYWCLVCVAGRANSMLPARDRHTPFRTQFGSGSLHRYHHQQKTVQRSWIHSRVWCGVWWSWWKTAKLRDTQNPYTKRC